MAGKGSRGPVFCAVDVETTGLFMSSRLLEIGAVKFDRYRVLEEYQTLVDPMQPIDPAATAIHGITDAMVRGCPSPGEAVARLLDFLADACFIAHNARFDVRVIGMELARAGMEPPPNPVIDTVRLARRLFSGVGNYKLDTLARYLGIERQAQHRGLPDAYAAIAIFRHFLDGSNGEYSVYDVPGYIGSFSELAPRVDIRLQGDESDFEVLARKQVMVEIVYRGGTRPGIPRMITPIAVRDIYLYAYCHRSGMVKSFRVDRVETYRIP